MRNFFLLTGMLISVSLVNARTPNAYEDTSRADATIKNATVYFGYGAELTHESKIRVNGNTKIIVISQLSTNVDINSLQISCPEDIALLSQRYQVFYPQPPVVEKSKNIEKLEDSIALLNKEHNRIQNLIG